MRRNDASQRRSPRLGAGHGGIWIRPERARHCRRSCWAAGQPILLPRAPSDGEGRVRDARCASWHGFPGAAVMRGPRPAVMRGPRPAVMPGPRPAVTRPAAGGDARPAAGGDARPAAGGDARPAAGGDARPAAGGDARPAAGGDARPAACGDARPAAGGDARGHARPSVPGPRGRRWRAGRPRHPTAGRQPAIAARRHLTAGPRPIAGPPVALRATGPPLTRRPR
jgi:hypothetical protein